MDTVTPFVNLRKQRETEQERSKRNKRKNILQM